MYLFPSMPGKTEVAQQLRCKEIDTEAYEMLYDRNKMSVIQTTNKRHQVGDVMDHMWKTQRWESIRAQHQQNTQRSNRD